MEIMTAYKFERQQLTHIDVFPPEAYDPSAHGNEPWVESLVYLAYNANNKELLYCLDANGTTDGDTNGVNILILAADLKAWKLAADNIGSTIHEITKELRGGTFGDGHASIALAQCDDTFYWIDELVSPAVAIAKAGIKR